MLRSLGDLGLSLRIWTLDLEVSAVPGPMTGMMNLWPSLVPQSIADHVTTSGVLNKELQVLDGLTGGDGAGDRGGSLEQR